MELHEKAVWVRCRDGRPVFPGFVRYVSATEPVLMHRYGWVDTSDSYDDFADCLSYDNGRTWTEPVPRLRSRRTATGRIRYAENAAWFDEATGRLLTFCSRGFYPNDEVGVDERFEVVTDEYDPATGTWRGEAVLPIELPGGLQISFCFPLLTRAGKLLVPAMTHVLGADGEPIHYPGCWAPVDQSLTLIGERGADGTFTFHAGRPVAADPEQSSRGHCENTLAELADGRLAMVMRGDNSMFPERPGTKWASLSDDGGESWSVPAPWRYDDGALVESGSNGSALVRSPQTNQLYWVGNLALDGERARGNWPRSPLAIAEVQEAPFALRRETICIIDRRGADEPPLTQLSNFRYYLDRETGELVVYLSRFGEHNPDEWRQADYWRYRVGLD